MKKWIWLLAAMVAAPALWLLSSADVDEIRAARFSATGVVLDARTGKPLSGVRTALTLSEPGEMDEPAYEEMFELQKRLWADEPGGTQSWVSDENGRFAVRVAAKYGLRYRSMPGCAPPPAHPFHTAWLVLQAKGQTPRVVAVDVSAWPFAGWNFEKPAQPLPTVKLGPDAGR